MSGSLPMAITMGDASGVGPEIVLRTAAEGGLGDHVVVYGDASILYSGQRLLGTSVGIRAIELPSEMVPGDLNVVDLRMLRPTHHRPGELERGSGRSGAGVCRTSDHRRVGGPRRGDRDHAHEQGGHAALRSAVRRAHRDDRRALRGAPGDDDAHERGDRGHPREHALLVARGDRARAGRSGARRHRADARRSVSIPLGSAHRGVRSEPSCRRARAVRHRGCGAHQSCDRGRAERGHRCVRSAPRGHRVPPGSAPGTVRRDRLHVSRPGSRAR